MNKINWKDYNKSLVNRGKITFWFSKDVLNSWWAEPSGKRGHPFTYSQTAIELLSIIRFRFGLSLRETQGFSQSLIDIMHLAIKSPDYSTLCRRLGSIDVQIRNQPRSNEPVHLAIDSTGLKVYGEGEWKVRMHGWSKSRTWRKLHLAVDEKNNQILSVCLSENSFKDNEVLEDLLTAIDDPIKQVSADGAYDCLTCYKVVESRGAKPIIPPRRSAILKRHGNSKDPPLTRDEHIREIKARGRKRWKKNHNYHRRSLSETAMYRFKTLIGERLSSREFEKQAIETFLKCKILNMMPTPNAL